MPTTNRQPESPLAATPERPQRSDQEPIELSIVVPALNEAGNIAPLVDQINTSCRGAGIVVELILVDDGSTDETHAEMQAAADTYDWIRVLHRPTAMGQSAAMHAGIQAARGTCVATLDADLQNDPADLVPMLAKIRAGEADMVQGDRSANRRDNAIRKFTSRIGQLARRVVIGDAVRDTGCSARVLKTEFAQQYPLQFKGMHRFLPAYAKMAGARIIEIPVNHRPRTIGTTKYGLGILTRGASGFVDLFAIRWMTRRHRSTAMVETSARRSDTGKSGRHVGQDVTPRANDTLGAARDLDEPGPATDLTPVVIAHTPPAPNASDAATPSNANALP